MEVAEGEFWSRKGNSVFVSSSSINQGISITALELWIFDIQGITLGVIEVFHNSVRLIEETHKETCGGEENMFPCQRCIALFEEQFKSDLRNNHFDPMRLAMVSNFALETAMTISYMN
jgi:hypothetical protein